jgi:hypothetical protein
MAPQRAFAGTQQQRPGWQERSEEDASHNTTSSLAAAGRRC